MKIVITKSLMQNMLDLEEDWKDGEVKNVKKVIYLFIYLLFIYT